MIRKAYEQAPQNGRLQQLYMAYESRHGNKQKVLEMRRRQLESRPSDYGNRRAIAILLAELDQADEAMNTIQAVIDDEGMTLANMVVLANTHRMLGDSARGAQVYQQYIQDKGDEADMGDYLLFARYLVEAGDGQGALNAYAQAISRESDQREASRELADLFFKRRAYDRAAPLYRELYEQFPDDERIGMRFADVLIKTRAFDEASEVLSNYGSDVQNADALRALIAEESGDRDEAIRLVTNAIESDPGKAVLYYERASIYARQENRLPNAMQDLNTALSLDPNHLLSRRLLVGLHLNQGQRNEAIRELRTLVTRHPDYKEGRLMLIRMLAQDGELVSARVQAREGSELAPQDPAWYGVRASLALQAGEVDEALGFYRKVMELAPTAGNLLTLVSQQINNDRSQEALSMLREHAELVNQQPVLQGAMSHALHASGNTQQSKQVASRALERCESFDQFMAVTGQLSQSLGVQEAMSLIKDLPNPRTPVWVGLSVAQLQLQSGDSKAAVQTLKGVESKLAADDAQSRQAYDIALAIALHHAGDHEGAKSAYQKVLEVQPDNTSVLNNLAYLLAEELDQSAQALPLVERAAELSPGNAQILDTLGWVQFKLGQVDKARATLESSIATQPLSANHLHLAEVLIDQGYKAQAGRHLKTAADLAEQNNETELLEQIQALQKQLDPLTEASLTP